MEITGWTRGNARGAMVLGLLALTALPACAQQTKPTEKPLTIVLAPSVTGITRAQGDAAKKLAWHTLEFAIVKFNDTAPNSWNIYHSEKKGVLLVRLWKRYLLVNVQDQEVFDIDPEKIKVLGDSVEWSVADVPEKPIDTPDWMDRNVGMLERVRFRLGKAGHFLELQLPLGPNGRPIY